jgi:hypothetical protein
MPRLKTWRGKPRPIPKRVAYEDAGQVDLALTRAYGPEIDYDLGSYPQPHRPYRGGKVLVHLLDAVDEFPAGTQFWAVRINLDPKGKTSLTYADSATGNEAHKGKRLRLHRNEFLLAEYEYKDGTYTVNVRDDTARPYPGEVRFRVSRRLGRRNAHFKMHPKLLLDVIQRQAGTLSKAILEGVMNAVDAGATHGAITLDG